MGVRIIVGDARTALRTLEAGCVDTVVTSPPYLGLRDYGVENQIGRERSVQEYVDNLAEVFREVRRVLRPEGVVFLNLGDSYGGSGKGAGSGKQTTNKGACIAPIKVAGARPRSLMLVPSRVAIRLAEDGWYVRSEIIWAKTNPLPESVKTRPTTAHERIWMLSQSEKHYYDDAQAVLPAAEVSRRKAEQAGQVLERGFEGMDAEKYAKDMGRGINPREAHWERFAAMAADGAGATRRLRSYERAPLPVWEMASAGYAEAHFATFPPELVERCLTIGCPPGGTVLDCFAGAGTTGLVADQMGRDAILCELSEDYAEMALRRIERSAPLTAEVAKEAAQEELFQE